MTKEELIKELESLGFRQSSYADDPLKEYTPFVYNINSFYDRNRDMIVRVYFYRLDGNGYRFFYDVMDQQFNVITGINLKNIEIENLDIPTMIALYK